MKKNPLLYEPHLTVRELSLLPGGEWQPDSSGWSLVQVRSGSGYCLQAQGSTELETGAVLLVVHLYRVEDPNDEEEDIRMISAREANKRERRIYL